VVIIGSLICHGTFCRRFGDIHNRAIDEVWYKRAVEQHYVDEESFVYSVPFDAGRGK
jgi:voltage-dependent calcium channel alpha-2/delta-3